MTDDLYTEIGSPMSSAAPPRLRGRDLLSEVVGEKSFSEAFYLVVTGRDLPDEHIRCFDACLVVLMDHGITPHALVARATHLALPDDVQLPMMAGAMLVGNTFAGAMAGAGLLLHEGAEQEDPAAWAAGVVTTFEEAKRPIPGFGHPDFSPTDPRSERLFEIAREAAVAGTYLDRAQVLTAELESRRGRPIPLNVTGALGAVLNELAFPVEVMRSVAALGRAAGLVGHVYEEMQHPIMPAVLEFVSEIEYREGE